MNQKQLEIMNKGKGFIAALDQSGGSTPKALVAYGVMENEYSGQQEMFKKVHEMRARIMTSPQFTNEHIIGVILFEETMYSNIEDMFTADYLWDVKKIVPFLKTDKGLADKENGVQLMKEMPELDKTLEAAVDRNIFGTKMRSVIWEDNEEGIKAVVKQQFDIGKQILAHNLMPIIEPEVNIDAENKAEIEVKLKAEIFKSLDTLEEGQRIMLKLTPPEVDDFYKDLVDDKRVLRVVFLSGGHPREKANELLTKNHGVIASFSRGFTEGLHVNQSKEEFDKMLGESALEIYQASIT